MTVALAEEAGESKIHPTPEEDRQLEELGFTRLGCFSQGLTTNFEQVLAVWKSPDGNAFAVPEGSARGGETFCAFRSLFVNGALVETSNEPDWLRGSLLGRTGVTIPAADYYVTYVEGTPLAEVWQRHQQNLSLRAVNTRVHRTMDEAVVISRYYAALKSRKASLVSALLPCYLVVLVSNWMLDGPKWLLFVELAVVWLACAAVCIPPFRRVVLSALGGLPRVFWPKAPSSSAE